MDEKLHRLIYQAIDQTISEDDFARLQDALEHDEATRQAYLRAVGLCESLSEIAQEPADSSWETARKQMPSGAALLRRNTPWRKGRQGFAAVTLMLLVGVGAFWLGRWNRQVPETAASGAVVSKESSSSRRESQIAGHATLRRAVDLQWPLNSVRRLEGDVLPHGALAFDAGVAEIDFFCGATLIVEGPAALDIESDWSVRVAEGRLRANVPPAARGFVVKAAESEIVDLGTEFALEVSSGNARVEVIDGEVELRGGQHDGRHLVTGEGASLRGTFDNSSLLEGLSTVSDIAEQRQVADEKRFRQWKADSESLRSDERLVAWFPVADGLSGRVIPNASRSGSRANALLVGPVERTTGRFGPASTGLEFGRPGARVRARIDGEFSSYSFACWARIDSLEHRYNSLFMADGYENGEPHWQIRDDGSLMFSVMVDDTQVIEHFSEIDQKMVRQAGRHHVYYTPPFWDISRSGQWFHLAAVYDPVSRQVTQYVNGEPVSHEKIVDRFHIATLRIGPAEIGNWGQPFRETPWFAVRNLNGTIDDLAIFDTALTAAEIQQLYKQGKPFGY